MLLGMQTPLCILLHLLSRSAYTVLLLRASFCAGAAGLKHEREADTFGGSKRQRIEQICGGEELCNEGLFHEAFPGIEDWMVVSRLH